ncbi:MAG TPA: hypothetical protein VGG30_10270, partial [Pirellulales bacterium]
MTTGEVTTGMFGECFVKDKNATGDERHQMKECSRLDCYSEVAQLPRSTTASITDSSDGSGSESCS